jgi:hypothetical protein
MSTCSSQAQVDVRAMSSVHHASYVRHVPTEEEQVLLSLGAALMGLEVAPRGALIRAIHGIVTAVKGADAQTLSGVSSGMERIIRPDIMTIASLDAIIDDVQQPIHNVWDAKGTLHANIDAAHRRMVHLMWAKQHLHDHCASNDLESQRMKALIAQQLTNAAPVVDGILQLIRVALDAVC